MFDTDKYEAGLRAAIAAGRVNLLNTLVFERNRASVVTMPTLGASSHSLNRAESEASAKLREADANAAHKIAVIERIMTERGESTTTYLCKSCGQHRASRTCSMCYEPREY